MRRAASIVAGALALPLAFSLPAVAQHLMERAQDEGMRQAQEALRKKLSPDQIKQVQEALEQKGFHVGRADGVVGRETRQAASNFQREQKLQQTGQIDEQTLQALGVSLNARAEGGAATTGAAPSGQNENRARPFGSNNHGDKGEQ
jgi:peptidoglycan hydrolase-like protein with peptidoglycan-binding domain